MTDVSRWPHCRILVTDNDEKCVLFKFAMYTSFRGTVCLRDIQTEYCIHVLRELI